MLGQDVAQLLQDFGSDLTLTRRVGGSYAPATGLVTGGTPTDFTVRAVFINYKDANVDGTVVRMGDRRLLVSTTGSQTAPIVGDVVGGLKLIDVRSIAPNGTPIAWACQARK
jgi:hypothetical protein